MPNNIIELVIRTVDQASSPLKSVGLNIEGLGDSLKSLAGTATAAFAAFESFKFVVGDIEQTQNAIAQLDAAYKATGSTLGLTRAQLDGLAHSFSNLSNGSTNTVRSAESILLTFDKIQGDIFPRTLQAATDLAARMGESLPQAAENLGRALEDPALGLQSLRRAGVIFSQQQRDLIAQFEQLGDTEKAQDLILNEVERRFSGSALAAANTLSGAIDNLKNAFLDLFQKVSESKVMQRFADAINGIASAIDPSLDQKIQSLTTRIKDMKDAAASGVVLNDTDLYQLKKYQDQLDVLLKQKSDLQAKAITRRPTVGIGNEIAAQATDLDEYADQLAQVKLYKNAEALDQALATLKDNSDWLDQQQQALSDLNKALEAAQQNTQTVQEKAAAADSKFVDDIRLLQKQGQISADEADTRLLARNLPSIDVDALVKNAPSLTKPLTDQYTQAIHGIQDAFAHMFDSINQGWDGMAKAFANAIQQMVSQLLSSSLMQLLFGATATNANGTSQITGGLFGGILSLFGGAGSGVSLGGVGSSIGQVGSIDLGALTASLPAFAGGGTAPGGLALVGENGPELVNLPGGTQVYNQKQLAGRSAVVNHSPTFVLNVAGSVDKETRGQILAATAQMISDSNKELVRTMKRNGYPLRS